MWDLNNKITFRDSDYSVEMYPLLGSFLSFPVSEIVAFISEQLRLPLPLGYSLARTIKADYYPHHSILLFINYYCLIHWRDCRAVEQCFELKNFINDLKETEITFVTPQNYDKVLNIFFKNFSQFIDKNFPFNINTYWGNVTVFSSYVLPSRKLISDLYSRYLFKKHPHIISQIVPPFPLNIDIKIDPKSLNLKKIKINNTTRYTAKKVSHNNKIGFYTTTNDLLCSRPIIKL